MAEAQRQRLAPEARKGLLLDAAQAIFVANGYPHSGLAEIADAAGVSKTLLYHYFPDGRPELYRAVIERLSESLFASLHDAAGAPVSPALRLTRSIEAVLAFFEGDPNAYRLVIVEPWGSGDPSIVGQAAAARVRLVVELAGILAAADRPVGTITAGATAAVGALLAIAELRVAGGLDADEVRSVAETFVAGGLAGLGLL